MTSLRFPESRLQTLFLNAHCITFPAWSSRPGWDFLYVLFDRAGRPLRGLRFGPFGADNLLEQGLKPQNLVPVNEQPSNPHSRAIFRTLQKYWNTEHHRGGVVVATPFRHRRPPMVFLPSLPVPRAVAPEGRREKLNLQSEGCSTTVPQPSFRGRQGQAPKGGPPKGVPLDPLSSPSTRDIFQKSISKSSSSSSTFFASFILS